MDNEKNDAMLLRYGYVVTRRDLSSKIIIESTEPEGFRMGDFIDRWLGWILVMVIAFLLGGIVAGAQDLADQRRAFMAECVKDRKEYECVAMWRAGESNTQYVPMPMIIPSGRR